MLSALLAEEMRGHLQAGRRRQAIEVAERYVALGGEDKTLLWNLATLYQQQDEVAKATELLKKIQGVS